MIETFTIVGGASAYAPGLVAALIHHANTLHLKEVRLYDIDERRLEIVSRLCDKMALAADCGFRVTATLDLVEAVKDVDAVLNSSRPGRFEGRKKDEDLPLEFDIPGQETVGPGGFFFGLRSVPEALKLASAMDSFAPKAMLLNYTNPTNIVTQALNDRCFSRVVGMCDQSDHDVAVLAKVLGRDSKDVMFDCHGLNHATWYAKLTAGGEPLILANESLTTPQDYDNEHKLRFEESVKLGKEFPGYWPNSYLPYYTAPARFVDLFRKEGTRTEHILKTLDSFYDHFEEEGRKEIPDLKRHRGNADFGDMAMRVVQALDDENGVSLVLNVPNRGHSKVFDGETVVEVRCQFGKNRLERGDAPELPAGQRDMLLRLEEYQREAAEASVNGSESACIKALTKNPQVSSAYVAEKMMVRAREVYGPMLPLYA